MLSDSLFNNPQIAAEYEALFFSNGTLFLNSTRGKHLQINNPPSFSRELLTLCEQNLSVEQILTKFEENIRGKVSKMLLKLAAFGVVKENLFKARPPQISEQVFARFKTEIEYFRMFENKENSAFDYFNRLRNARVCVLGVGGNGSIIAMMLAAAGVGHIHLVDGDHVEESNLLRQIFYTESDAELKIKKVDSLKSKIENLSKYTKVTVSAKYISTADDLDKEIIGNDCVVLAADMPRFKINYWVNEKCNKYQIANINAFSGIIGPFVIPGESDCFDCFENMFRRKVGPVHDEIVSALQKPRNYQYPSFVAGVGELASIQTNEVIKYITKILPPVTLNSVLHYTNGSYQTEKIEHQDRCPVCVKREERKNVNAI